jgi:hypothetical protein
MLPFPHARQQRQILWHNCCMEKVKHIIKGVCRAIAFSIVFSLIWMVLFDSVQAQNGILFQLCGTALIFTPFIGLVVLALKKRWWLFIGIAISLPTFFALTQLLFGICFSLDLQCYI